MRTLWLLPFALLACAHADGDPAPRGPLVVELFTSQGCSSCPPADRVLADLAKESAVVPLAFHVDYWDDLGWPDPYASATWTARQREYARALGDDRVYTPELVVGGTAGMVGSQRTKVTAAIAAAKAPALLIARGTWSDKQLEITATAPEGADVWVAVWEARVENAVTRGENAGEKLGSTNVVRKLERVAAAGKSGTRTIKLDPAWRAVGAVAFAQRSDKAIVASAVLAR